MHIYAPCLKKTGFYYDESNQQYGKDMLCYTLQQKYGTGHYWLYPYEDLFCISIKDFHYNSDFYMEYPRNNALNISHFQSVESEELNPYRSLSCSCIYSRVDDSSTFKALIHKNVPIQSTGIEIMPAYYQTYLKEHYHDTYSDPRIAFSNIENITNIPELTVVFKQIQNFKGEGLSAKLYYSGKVAEVISIIIEKNSALNLEEPKKKVHISVKDSECLDAVSAYIDDHYNIDIHLDMLSRIACMGSTKLKLAFKQTYNCTISEYILKKRIAKAEDLLANTDDSIQHIAKLVGYKHPINFTKTFSKVTGYLPRDYRKVMSSVM